MNEMTEREAVRVLLDQLAGPSARFDAERTLTGLGWPPLAIALARCAGAAGLAALKEPAHDDTLAAETAVRRTTAVAQSSGIDTTEPEWWNKALNRRHP